MAVRPYSYGEVFGRLEGVWEDVDGDADTYLTVGASVSPSAARGREYHRFRLTLAYAERWLAAGDDARLLVLQGQLAF